MVLIESAELIDSLSLLLRMSEEFRIHEASKTYEDIIRLIKGMENDVILKDRNPGYLYSSKVCKRSASGIY